MKRAANIKLSDVQAVYSGVEAHLWKLLMGEQIHVGGLQASIDLAEQAGIKPGSEGVDLCSGLGTGLRFLIRFRQVAKMTGVDATPAMNEFAQQRCLKEGFGDRVKFVEADVCASGLPDASYDFVWGEDAWCYVADKPKLMAEAARLLKPNGTIAFTDWLEGPSGWLKDDEAARYLSFMKFPNILTLEEYLDLLNQNNFRIRVAHDTGRMASHFALYVDMLEKQLTYDAWRMIGFNAEVMHKLAAEMRFVMRLAQEGKIYQGLLIATKDS